MFEKVKAPLILLTSFFILLFLYTHLAGPIPFFVNSVQTTKTDIFHVDGTGKVSAAPDAAAISFGVTKTANTIADAHNQTNTLIAKITDALKGQGIEDKNIKTTNYTVSPNYDFSSGRQTITGYTVSQTINLTIPQLDKVNSIIDALTSNGANIVNQVSFIFSDSKRNDLENQARKMAVAEAKAKAEGLASAAGIHLGQLINVEEQPELQQTPLDIAKTSAPGLGAAPTQVTPGENSISLTVTLTYQTY